MTTIHRTVASPSRPIILSDTDHRRLELLIRDFKANAAEGQACLDALAGELRRATIVPPSDMPADVVTMNSTVRLRIKGMRQPLTCTLVYPSQADLDAGRISVFAPLATAVLGLRVGDRIEQQLPGGTKEVVVEKMIYQPEAAGDHHL